MGEVHRRKTKIDAARTIWARCTTAKEKKKKYQKITTILIFLFAIWEKYVILSNWKNKSNNRKFKTREF